MLILSPPTYSESIAALREGSRGWPVYAIQTGLNALGATLALDGDFGPATRAAVLAFQKREWPADPRQQDGVVGPGTKRRLVERIAERVDRELPQLPDRLIRELCKGEGGDNTSAINPYTPPGGLVGTDCGIMQYRCYEPYTRDALEMAFDPYRSMRAAAADFEARKAKYLTYGWGRNNRVRAERLALMAHNWPVGANDIAFEGRLTNPDGIAAWVPYDPEKDIYVRMLDGTIVRTRQQWVDFYAMGSAPACGPVPATVQWGV